MRRYLALERRAPFRGKRLAALWTIGLGASLALTTADVAHAAGDYETLGARSDAENRAPPTGVLRGHVEEISVSRGLVQMRLLDAGQPGRSVVLRARPNDVVGLNRGDVITVRYGNFDGGLWILLRESEQRPSQALGPSGTISGPVSEVDEANGLITVEGSIVRVHPQLVQDVLPGQWVSLSYSEIQGTPWVSQVSRGAGHKERPSGAGQVGEHHGQSGETSQRAAPRGQPATATIRGVVRDVDLSQGIVRLTTKGRDHDGRPVERVVALRARPSDIMDLEAGDSVSLPYANYAGSFWITERRGDRDLTRAYGQSGIVSGQVTEVDVSGGTITVEGMTVLVHPQQVRTVVPGQWVSVSYADVDGAPWAADVRRTERGPTDEELREEENERR